TRGRSIEQQMPADLPAVLGVRDQLVQVFLNLILNAIDATAQGGHIVIRAAAETDGFVQVCVEDDGAGIAAENAGRLLPPYFTTKRHGPGLGLFVTRKLVTDHGGAVDFRSQGSRGTVFRVRLPAASPVLEHVPTPVIEKDLASLPGV